MSLNYLKRYFFAIALTQGFLIWYAIDKIFFLENGVSLQQVVILGILAWVPQVIFEIPSSTLADRWSRKGVLFIGALGLFLSTLVIGLGANFEVFAAGVLIWSFSNAMLSGTFEAFLFDSLKVQGNQKLYKTINSRITSLELISSVLAGLAAYIVSISIDLRYAFFLSLPSVALSMYFLAKIPEPPITRTTHQKLNWFKHISDAGVVLRSQLLRWLAGLLVLLVAFRSIMFEYYQLVAAEHNFNIGIIALLFSVVLLGMALGAEMFGWVSLKPRAVGFVWLLFGLACTVGMLASSVVLVFINLFVLFGCLQFLELYLDLSVQNRIDSSKKATILSSASAVGQLMFLGLAVIFGYAVVKLGASGAISLVSLPLLAFGALEIARYKLREAKVPK